MNIKTNKEIHYDNPNACEEIRATFNIPGPMKQYRLGYMQAWESVYRRGELRCYSLISYNTEVGVVIVKWDDKRNIHVLRYVPRLHYSPTTQKQLTRWLSRIMQRFDFDHASFGNAKERGAFDGELVHIVI